MRSIGIKCRLKGSADYKLQKRIAADESHRDAYNFVHKHGDLILGASREEINRAVQKIGDALRELRIAKLDAEVAKRAAVLTSADVQEWEKIG